MIPSIWTFTNFLFCHAKDVDFFLYIYCQMAASASRSRSLHICIQGRTNGPSQLSRGFSLSDRKIFPKEAPIRLIISYWIHFFFLPKELIKEITSLHFASTTFNRGFAIDVLWEATKREVMYWVKT